MQYVWQHRLFSPVGLKTVDGRRVNILNPGALNTAQGPDFSNASIEIDGQRWVGTVEFHVRASDWHRHGHDGDKAYDSVILHVVDVDDTSISRTDGTVIPQLRLPCSTNLNAEFHRLTDTAPADLPCAQSIAEMPQLYLTDWITALAYQRVQEKADRIGEILTATSRDWEQTCYITLARALGFGLNAEPMERLARSLQLRFLRKHADSHLAIEALMFGQAGLLPRESSEPYIAQLVREYDFLSKKFGLTPLESPCWKLGGTRPQNFPQRRIALLAEMVCRGFSLMSEIAHLESAEHARKLFDVQLTGYWASHYTIGGAPCERAPLFSGASADLLVINCVVPLLYAWGTECGDYSLTDRAIELLFELRGESNRLISVFKAGGIKVPDAFTSQALIQLRREYCEKRKCIYCRIGHRHLASRALRMQ